MQAHLVDEARLELDAARPVRRALTPIGIAVDPPAHGAPQRAARAARTRNSKKIFSLRLRKKNVEQYLKANLLKVIFIFMVGGKCLLTQKFWEKKPN